MNPGHSTWPSGFGSSRHTSGLIGDVCQAGQAAGKFGKPTIGEQLVDGGGFSHSPCGDHRHRSEQSAAAGTDRAQDLTLGLPTSHLKVEEEEKNKQLMVSSRTNLHSKEKGAKTKHFMLCLQYYFKDISFLLFFYI